MQLILFIYSFQVWIEIFEFCSNNLSDKDKILNCYDLNGRGSFCQDFSDMFFFYSQAIGVERYTLMLKVL